MSDTAPPRSLTLDEEIRVRCLRKFFNETRSAIERMLPEGWHRDMALFRLAGTEEFAVRRLEVAMRGER